MRRRAAAADCVSPLDSSSNPTINKRMFAEFAARATRAAASTWFKRDSIRANSARKAASSAESSSTFASASFRAVSAAIRAFSPARSGSDSAGAVVGAGARVGVGVGVGDFSASATRWAMNSGSGMKSGRAAVMAAGLK